MHIAFKYEATERPFQSPAMIRPGGVRKIAASKLSFPMPMAPFRRAGHNAFQQAESRNLTPAGL